MKNMKLFTFLTGLALSASVLCAQNISVMSLNMGKDAEGHGWDSRKAAIAGMIEDQAPLVMGAQDCNGSRTKDIKKNLKNYDVIERGSEPIFYRSGKATVLDFGQVGSRGTWAVLLVEGNHKMIVVNTYFDGAKEEDRCKQAEEILAVTETIAAKHCGSYALQCPCIVMGDLQSKPSSWSGKVLNPCRVLKNRLIDARQIAVASDSKPSYNGWGTAEKNVDYIFYENLAAWTFRTITEKYEGIELLSNHYAIISTFSFK